MTFLAPPVSMEKSSVEIPFLQLRSRKACVLGCGWGIAAKKQTNKKPKQRESSPGKITANILVYILASASLIYKCLKELSKYKF